MLAFGEEEALRNIGFGRKRKERKGKMKRRLMRSLTPPWLQTYIHAHTNLNAMVKPQKKLSTYSLAGQLHRTAASFTHLNIATTTQ